MGQNGKWCYPMQAIDEEVLQRKADLGTAVHAAISAHVNDEFIPTSAKEDGYVKSYLEWEKSISVKPITTDLRIYYEPMKLTGSIDMLACLGSSEKSYLIDFKCTVAQDPVKWPLQAAFYAILADLNGIEIEKTCFFVQLDQNGLYPKVWEYEITKGLTSAALAAYNLYIHLTNK
jgi:hypothetical protein